MKRSALTKFKSGRRKTVRWADEGALVCILGAAAGPPDRDVEPAADEPKPAAGIGSIYRGFTVTTTAIARPLFNIPITGSASKKADLGEGKWASSSASLRRVPSHLDEQPDDDVEYEEVWEWFCDECGAAVPDYAVRYECATCPEEYCRCQACYRKSVVSGASRHAHPLVSSSRPHHVTKPPAGAEAMTAVS
ncbi:hypothetical protein M885DRAFT_506050 [Pelagophyceae sp. CCMP2097]|nr:hypothetical protein M885DRAFT_506050 [Pelagophyceae sp. CCMP2097]